MPFTPKKKETISTDIEAHEFSGYYFRLKVLFSYQLMHFLQEMQFFWLVLQFQHNKSQKWLKYVKY